MANIYLIGSLRNPDVRPTAQFLREAGHTVFDQWHAAGEKADEEWAGYFHERGADYPEALRSPFVQHIVAFDREWLEWADTVVLLYPAGVDGHIELVWAAGRGKRPVIYAPQGYNRWGAMLALIDPSFARTPDELLALLL